MKKTIYAVMLLLGLSMMASCGENKSYKETETSSNDLLNERAKSSSHNMDRAFSKEIDKNGYVYFSTQYEYDKKLQYYMVFYPFVYSKDGLDGIMYLVYYGDNWNNSIKLSQVTYYADYKVVGDYLRLTNIVQRGKNTTCPNPIIYKIDKSDGKLRLNGRFIRQTSKSVNIEETGPLPKTIIDLIGADDLNLHTY